MLFAYLGAAFIIGLAIFRLLRYYNKTKTYYTVIATVIDNRIEYIQGTIPGDTLTYYYPVLEFVDKDGITQTFVSSQDNPDRPVYKVNDTVKLLVNHNDASRFIFKDIIEGYIIPIIWIVVGIAVPIVVKMVLDDK